MLSGHGCRGSDSDDSAGDNRPLRMPYLQGRIIVQVDGPKDVLGPGRICMHKNVYKHGRRTSPFREENFGSLKRWGVIEQENLEDWAQMTQQRSAGPISGLQNDLLPRYTAQSTYQDQEGSVCEHMSTCMVDAYLPHIFIPGREIWSVGKVKSNWIEEPLSDLSSSLIVAWTHSCFSLGVYDVFWRRVTVQHWMEMYYMI